MFDQFWSVFQRQCGRNPSDGSDRGDNRFNPGLVCPFGGLNGYYEGIERADTHLYGATARVLPTNWRAQAITGGTAENGMVGLKMLYRGRPAKHRILTLTSGGGLLTGGFSRENGLG